jgi:hypothetical protein
MNNTKYTHSHTHDKRTISLNFNQFHHFRYPESHKNRFQRVSFGNVETPRYVKVICFD